MPNPNQNPYGAYNPINEHILYPLDNPGSAIKNAMSDVGINPYSGNPFSKAVQRLAPALGSSYLVEQASNGLTNTPGGIAATGQGYANGQRSSMPFSTYLRGTLTGQDTSTAYNPPASQGASEYPHLGGPQQNLGYIAGWMPNAFRGVRDYRQQLGAGNVNFQTLNPFMAALSEQAGANNGQGTVDILSNVMTPFMAPGMASAYTRALQSQGDQAIRRLSIDGPNSSNDIWTYLLGI